MSAPDLNPQEDILEGEEIPDAVVEDVPDDLYVDEGPRIVQPQVSSMGTLEYCARYVMSMNPWLLLIIAIVVYKIWQRIKPGIMERYYDWQERKKEEEYAARYHKNPDEFRQKMEAMDLARAAMQEKYDKDAMEWAEKMREKEERRRQQDIEDWEAHKQGKGYKNAEKGGEDSQREALKKQAAIKGKKGYKQEYNPLMGGGGGGSGYRPSPRSSGLGGGG